jgi:predicted DNA-binding protein YlxM (UPF0122 family)
MLIMGRRNPTEGTMKADEAVYPINDRERYIWEMSKAGFGLREIGQRVGVSHERVRQILKRMRDPRPRGSRTPGYIQERTTKRVKQLREWAEQGITMAEAAWLLDMTPQAIYHFSRRHGIKMKLGGTPMGLDATSAKHRELREKIMLRLKLKELELLRAELGDGRGG